MGLSAVCAYSLAALEDVFSKGKYMQKATVEQSHTKWVRYNGITPSPRPGAVSSSNETSLIKTELSFVGTSAQTLSSRVLRQFTDYNTNRLVSHKASSDLCGPNVEDKKSHMQ